MLESEGTMSKDSQEGMSWGVYAQQGIIKWIDLAGQRGRNAEQGGGMALKWEE